MDPFNQKCYLLKPRGHAILCVNTCFVEYPSRDPDIQIGFESVPLNKSFLGPCWLSAIIVILLTYLKLLTYLSAILIPVPISLVLFLVSILLLSMSILFFYFFQFEIFFVVLSILQQSQLILNGSFFDNPFTVLDYL